MDAWGTGISANDTYAMVRDEFFGAYDEGAEPADITKQILEDHKDLSVDPEESHHFWFALARCQWECKALQPEVFERVRDLIESGKDIELWRRTEGVEEGVSGGGDRPHWPTVGSRPPQAIQIYRLGA